MKRLKTIGLALLAVFALSAVAASAAQAVTAPFFTIGGTRLVAGKTHNFDSRALPGGAGFTLSTPAAGLKITCTSLQVKEGVLLGSNAGQPGKDDEIAIFTSCKQTGNGTEPGCKVKEPIETKPLASELVEIDATKQTLGEEFKPKTGTEFVEVKFEGGAECSVGVAANVDGEVAAQVLTDNGKEEALELGQTATQATSWLVKFPSTPITEVLLVNSKGEKETRTLEALSVLNLPSSLSGTTLTLLASTKFVPEPTALWSPLP
jgi:hypothetical protein